MALTFLVSLVLASMLNPTSAWAFLFQIILILTLLAAIIRVLFHWVGPSPWDRNYAMQGLAIGGLPIVFTWMIPIPVAVIARIFDVQGHFGNITLMSMPFLIILPLVGACVGILIPRSRSSDEDES